jgi:membrane-bound lytic murein transglycosylase B
VVRHRAFASPALVFALAACCVPAVARAQQPDVQPVPARPTFAEWLAQVRTEAIAGGLKASVVGEALDSAEHVEVVLERDRTQPEFVLPLDRYLERRLDKATVRTAQDRLERHRPLLRRVSGRYGVPPEVITAVWGLESNFGRFAGVRPTISVLATLGYESRRGEYFRLELFEALRILDRGDIELAKLRGSWAGALGQPQFMPSNYMQYAVDFDADGRRDIWSSDADVFASIANFLRQKGWVPGERWGREVEVSPAAAPGLRTGVAPRGEGCRAVRQLSVARPLAEWQKLGVRLPKGRPLPRAEVDASLLEGGSRLFLVYRNYDTLLAYNCANSYALSVALLSDRLSGVKPAAKKGKANSKPKSKSGGSKSGSAARKPGTAAKP